MQEQQVKATVVVPLWNHRTFIEHQLKSLIQQWRPDLELLVIDDGSTDEGFGVAQVFLEAHPAVRATLMRNERTLGASLPNVALRQASGPIIIEADSDDFALPNRIERLLRRFDDDPSCHLVTSNALRISIEGVAVGLLDTVHGDTVFRNPAVAAEKMGDARWLGATAAFRREVFEMFSPIDNEICAPFLDLLLPLRATLLGTHYYLSEPLVGWRQHTHNAHRMLGALEVEGPRAERFKFLELTILAQKLRDVQFLQERTRNEEWNAVLENCNRFFFDTFTEWSRFRMRLERAPSTADSKQALPYVSAIPPILTLRANSRVAFSFRDVGGQAAARSPGFHAAEEWGIWTEGHALLSFRLGDEAVTRLTICLQGLPFLDSQHVRILLVGSDWLEFELRNQGAEVEVPLPATARAGHTITIVLSTPGAAKPADLSESQDGRLLGIGLFWVSAN